MRSSIAQEVDPAAPRIDEHFVYLSALRNFDETESAAETALKEQEGEISEGIPQAPARTSCTSPVVEKTT